MPIPLIFDTSIVRGISLREPSPEFKLLKRLADEGWIILLMPEMATREWIGQRLESPLKALDQLKAAIVDLRQQVSIKDHASAKAILKSKLHDDKVLDALRDASSNWYADALRLLGFQVMPVTLTDTTLVLDAYIGGALPFRGKRVKEDFPDGFVFAAASRKFDEDPRAIFVCADGRLADAAVGRGIAVARSLPDLLKMSVVASLSVNAEFARWWTKNGKKVIRKLKSREGDLKTTLENDLVEAITSEEVHDDEIPSDGGEAWVGSAGPFNDLDFDWGSGELLGEGVLEVPFSFDADIDLEFYMYRSESLDPPEWVSVTFGDWESDHYFEASGSRSGRYTARLVVGVPQSFMSKKGRLDLDDLDLSVEDVTFASFSDGISRYSAGPRQMATLYSLPADGGRTRTRMSRGSGPPNWCPHCIASRSPECSVRRWAALLANATEQFIDAEMLAMLDGPMVRISAEMDEPTRRRVSFVQIARHFAAKGEVRCG